jgi:hypothetical protein
MRSRRIVSWVVAILTGVVAEIGVFAVMPVALHFGPTGPFYAIPPAAFVMTFLAGLFAASVARSRLMAHGAVVGLVAALIYIAITVGQRLPAAWKAPYQTLVGGLRLTRWAQGTAIT